MQSVYCIISRNTVSSTYFYSAWSLWAHFEWDSPFILWKNTGAAVMRGLWKHWRLMWEHTWDHWENRLQFLHPWHYEFWSDLKRIFSFKLLLVNAILYFLGPFLSNPPTFPKSWKRSREMEPQMNVLDRTSSTPPCSCENWHHILAFSRIWLDPFNVFMRKL